MAFHEVNISISYSGVGKIMEPKHLEVSCLISANGLTSHTKSHRRKPAILLPSLSTRDISVQAFSTLERERGATEYTAFK